MGIPIGRRNTPETDLVRAILQLLRLRGIYAWRNNTTGVYDPVKGVFRKFTGLKGVSDVLGVLPDGRFLAIEAKAPKGRSSPEQQTFIDDINGWGGLAFLARSLADVDEALRREGYL